MRRGLSLYRAPLAACLFLLATGAAAALPAAKERWTALDTDHFSLFTNMSPDLARDAANHLARLRQVLEVFPGNLPLATRRPNYLYVFRDPKSARAYVRRAELEVAVAGIFLHHPDANYLIVQNGPAIELASLLYHEYLHAMISDGLGRPPLWLNEGLAELFGTLRVNAESAELGGVIEGYRERLAASRPMSLRGLFEVTPASDAYRERASKDLFHAQAWALVHYLSVGSERRRAELGAFLDLLAQGTEPDDAFARAFRGDYDGLQAELHRYLERETWPSLTLPLPPPAPPPPPPRALNRVETLFRLGDLAAHGTRGSSGAAERHFRAALAIDADHRGARTGMGLLHARAGRYEAAEEHLAAGAPDEPADVTTCFLGARVLMQLVSAEADGADALRSSRLARARALLEQGIRLEPGYVELHVALGYSYLLGQGNLGIARRILIEAGRLAPFRHDVTYYLLRLQLLHGDRAAARELERRLAAHPPWSEMAEVAVVEARVDEANALLRAGETARAAELARQVLSRTDGSALQELARRRLDPALRALHGQQP